MSTDEIMPESESVEMMSLEEALDKLNADFPDTLQRLAK